VLAAELLEGKKSFAQGGSDSQTDTAPRAEALPPIQVVVWGAPWCHWCTKNKPELKRLHKSGRYVIMFINYDDHKDFAKAYGITKLPSYFVVENNRVVYKTNNLQSLKSYTPRKTHELP